jgi:hypothetical protein
VRRVFSSLAGLNSVFGNALHNATQIFFDRIPQMTKYFITRECEHIGDTVIGHGIGGKVIPAKMAQLAGSQLLE